MMAFLGAAIVVISAWLLGRALLPGRSVLKRDFWEEQTISYLVGSSALALGAMGLAWIGIAFHAWVAWLLLFIGMGAGAWRFRKDRQEALAPSLLLPWQRYLLISIGIAAALLTVSYPLNAFDPIFHFAYKGKVLYHTGDPLDEAFTGMVDAEGEPLDVGRIMTHPNYPLGVPFLEAFAAHAGFGWSERWVQLPLAFWALCLSFTVGFALRPFGARAVRWGSLILAVTPMLYVREFLAISPFSYNFSRAGLGGTLNLGGVGDLPIAALLAAGCALLLRAQHLKCRRAALCAGICLAGATFMKNEGLALVGVLIIALAMGDPLAGKKAWLLRATCFAACIVAVLPWLIHRGNLPAIDENYTEQFSVSNIIDHWTLKEKVNRSPVVFQGGGENNEELENPPLRRANAIRVFLEALFLPTYPGQESEGESRIVTGVLSFGIFWFLFLLSFPIGFLFKVPEARWLCLCVLGGVFLYFLIVLITPWYLPTLVGTGIPQRLLLHLVGPAAILMGIRMATREQLQSLIPAAQPKPKADAPAGPRVAADG